jgi:hypothetical protein
MFVFLVLGILLGAKLMSSRYDSKFISMRTDLESLKKEISNNETPQPTGTTGAERNSIIAQAKKELQDEMGLLPITLMRDRSASFVELNSYDNRGTMNYGTAGYLGNGYFITVKHGVVSLEHDSITPARKIESVKLSYKGRQLIARIVDVGDAEVEVDPGDWAILKVSEKIDLPALEVNTNFGFTFAEPIFRLGNDYSKGVVLATGYIGQRMPSGLVSALTDGHPGVSGGGVLDRHGVMVGIPIGRMQGDFRFSFILPLRAEMFRKVPHFAEALITN